MLLIIVPLVILFAIATLPIPKIGKNLKVALLSSSVIALLLGGVTFGTAFSAGVKGIDQIAWVAFLAIFGSIFAQSQLVIGSIDTILNIFRSLFGHSTKGLIVAIMMSLALAGSLIGSATASACVIGILVVKALEELELDPEHITAILLLGGILGSIMPPISQALFLSSSLLETNVDPVLKLGYMTTAIGLLIGVYITTRFVKIKELPAELIPEDSAGQILKKEWKKLIPVMSFVIIIILRTAFKIELLKYLDFFWNIFKPIPILSAFKERIVQALIVSTIISLFYPKVLKEAKKFTVEGLKSVKETVITLSCAGIMIGAFSSSGMIQRIVTLSEALNKTAIKLGGGAFLALLGMITGSQSTAQTTLVPVLGPILVNNAGVDPTRAAFGLGNIAMAGQSLPPADLVTFVIAGLVAGIIGKKVDPLKVMYLALPVTLYFLFVGLAALFI